MLKLTPAHGPPIPSPACKVWVAMSCKACASEHHLDCPAELSFTFPGVKQISLPSAYLCHHVLVCLDCGYAELVNPAPKLQRLNQGMVESSEGNARRDNPEASKPYGSSRYRRFYFWHFATDHAKSGLLIPEKEAPPSPCRKYLQEFIDFAAGANRTPIGFYQAYPGLSVQDIRALIADSKAESASAG